MTGENDADPSVAALVFGRKSLAGYRVTDPLLLSNSTLDMSSAWMSDLLRPLASNKSKNVLCVRYCREHVANGSNGCLVNMYKTNVISHSGRIGARLGL